jgi:dipeptidyl aminopeptidase/acylaminoacyl peptidase
LPPVALLLLHGRRDPDVPAASAEALHAALVPHYAGCPERLALKVYPALGHTISRPESAEVAAAQQELREELNAWFKRFL